MKAGIRTSEFWVTAVLALATLVNQMLPEGQAPLELSDEVAAGAVAFLAGLYTVARSWVKRSF